MEKVLEKVPIWLTDWDIITPRKKKHTVTNIVCKGNSIEDLLNNKVLINKVLRKYKATGKIDKFKVANIKLISQHGYGPKEWQYTRDKKLSFR